MAKSSRTSSPDPTAVLDGLRKALAGPKPLQGKGDALFPAGAKGAPLAEEAIAQGYLIRNSVTVPPAGKKGKPKEVVLGELTDKGRQFVLEADSPKATLEALLPAVQALATGATPRSAAENFQPQLDQATRACVRAIEEGFAKLQKSVEAALAILEQVMVKAVPTTATRTAADAGPILAALQAALARASMLAPPGAAPATPRPIPSPGVPPAPSAGPLPAQGPKPAPAPAPAITGEQLRAALREAYDHLCLFAEFRDKLVELPRLYHEAARRLPGLSVPRFHRELEALSSERRLELHKLNEVHMAKERELAIEKDDRLYYYVYWK